MGTGVARIDAGVTFHAPGSTAGTIAVTTEPMPTTTGDDVPGASIRGMAPLPIGAPVLLAVALLGPPRLAPGLADEVWTLSGTDLLAAFGVPQPGVPVSSTINVPATPDLRGVTVAWQSLALLGGRLVAANPTVTVVR